MRQIPTQSRPHFSSTILISHKTAMSTDVMFIMKQKLSYTFTLQATDYKLQEFSFIKYFFKHLKYIILHS